MPGRCAEALPKNGLFDGNVLELCTDAKSTHPASCYANLLKSLKRRIKDKENRQQFALVVCKNATDELIERCVTDAPKVLNMDQMITLCGGGGNPIPCFELFRRKHRDKIKLGIEICRGVDSVFPASCSIKIPKEYNAMEICMRATSEAPAECARFFKRKGRHGLKTGDINIVCAHTTTLGPAMCVASCPKNLAGYQKVALCKNASSVEPARCYEEAISDKRIRSKRRQVLTVDYIVKLCQNAESVAPALCMKHISDKRLNLTERVHLCRNADSDIPAICYSTLSKIIKSRPDIIDFCRSKKKHMLGLRNGKASSQSIECVLNTPAKLSDSDKLALCSAASSSAPGKCLQRALASNVPKKHHIALCRGTTSSNGPVDCFSVTTGDIIGVRKAKLCAKATSAAPARCVQKIISQHMSPNDKIHLCEHAIDDWPAKCSNAIPRRGVISEVEVSRLCNGAKNLDPGQCFLSAPPLLSSSQKILLCHGVLVSQHVVKCASSLTLIHDLEKRISFCSKATSPLLLRCMSQVPYGWPSDLKLLFCSKVKSRGALLCLKNLPPRLSPVLESSLCVSAVNSAPVLCLQGMPGRYTDNEIVEMCQGARSDMPARCARAATARVSAHDVVFACKRARSPSPGQCLAYYSGISSPNTVSALHECHGAVSIPSEVVVMDGWQIELSYHERGGETLLTSQIVAIVHNQYGAQMKEQKLLPKLYANVDRGREIGAQLIGLRSVSADERGRYVFSPIKIKSSRGGIFWIRIGGAAIKATRIPFRVRTNTTSNLTRSEAYGACLQ